MRFYFAALHDTHCATQVVDSDTLDRAAIDALRKALDRPQASFRVPAPHVQGAELQVDRRGPSAAVVTIYSARTPMSMAALAGRKRGEDREVLRQLERMQIQLFGGGAHSSDGILTVPLRPLLATLKFPSTLIVPREAFRRLPTFELELAAAFFELPPPDPRGARPPLR